MDMDTLSEEQLQVLAIAIPSKKEKEDVLRYVRTNAKKEYKLHSPPLQFTDESALDDHLFGCVPKNVMSSNAMPVEEKNNDVNINDKGVNGKESSSTDAQNNAISTTFIKNYERLKCVQCLGSVEQYFLKIHDIPRLPQRVTSMIFRSGFEYTSSKVSSELDKVLVASSQLRSSRQLAKVLRALLKVGNHLNGGTSRANAVGFSLDTLRLVASVKSSGDRSTSLLHFVIDQMMRCDGAGETMMMSEELRGLAAASSVSMDALNSMLRELTAGLKKVNDEIIHAAVGEENDQHGSFRDRMIDFATRAEDRLSEVSSKMDSAVANLHELCQYFGEDFSKERPMHCVQTVREFLIVYDKVHGEVMARLAKEKKKKETKVEDITDTSVRSSDGKMDAAKDNGANVAKDDTSTKVSPSSSSSLSSARSPCPIKPLRRATISCSSPSLLSMNHSPTSSSDSSATSLGAVNVDAKHGEVAHDSASKNTSSNDRNGNDDDSIAKKQADRDEEEASLMQRRKTVV